MSEQPSIQAYCIECQNLMQYYDEEDGFWCDGCRRYDSTPSMMDRAIRVIREMHRYIESVRRGGSANRV